MDLSPFQLYEPETLTTGVVFSSPHSGRTYPETFRRQSDGEKRLVACYRECLHLLLPAFCRDMILQQTIDVIYKIYIVHFPFSTFEVVPDGEKYLPRPVAKGRSL